ncbi:hypothetical protein EMGBS2_01890, partial [Actinomycetota bacterium]
MRKFWQTVLPTSAQRDEVVKVMTVHSAKG